MLGEEDQLTLQVTLQMNQMMSRLPGLPVGHDRDLAIQGQRAGRGRDLAIQGQRAGRDRDLELVAQRLKLESHRRHGSAHELSHDRDHDRAGDHVREGIQSQALAVVQDIEGNEYKYKIIVFKGKTIVSKKKIIYLFVFKIK